MSLVTIKVAIGVLAAAVLLFMLLGAIHQERHQRGLKERKAQQVRRSVRAQAMLWAQIIRGVSERQGQLACVEDVYQEARRGTKAIIRWHGTGEPQDAWFEATPVFEGQWLLLRGRDGYGWHHGTNCRYVKPDDVLVIADPNAPDCFRQIQASPNPAVRVL